jgi:hypothetical protein
MGPSDAAVASVTLSMRIVATKKLFLMMFLSGSEFV